MFIWTAILIEPQLLNQKKRLLEVERQVDFKNPVASTLPLHISLKISSEVPKQTELSLRKDIENLFKTIKPFDIELDKIEHNETIVWIKIKNNNNLINLHDKICSLFNKKYSILLHEFDKSFIFHTTLIMDKDSKKVEEAFNELKNMELPKVVHVDRFVIGASMSGIAGTYFVDKEIII